MATNYPTIGEYNHLIQLRGGNAFRTLNGINLIPSSTSPIKVYLFGSGAFAAVFKAVLNGDSYAIRCFLAADVETVKRYKSICDYLKNVNSRWKTSCEFIEDEIIHNGNLYPVLKMEWIEGMLINQFVSMHLHDNNVLSELQVQLVSLSEDLENNKIGHGDIQCGNIIIKGSLTGFHLKLIDYDGMFVPSLAFKKSIEKGRSEFQHPKRSFSHFDSAMDRFSFWVIITALEALKLDKTLWREVMQGGFNTLDNFLFTSQDFINPNQSILFKRLFSYNSVSLNFYLEKLIHFCISDYNFVTRPYLFQTSTSSTNAIPVGHKKYLPLDKDKQAFGSTISDSKFKIVTQDCTASVLTSTLRKIGMTPLELDKETYSGKLILISNGKETKQVVLLPTDSTVEIKFN